MADKRTVEIFSAGCAICDEVENKVRSIACPSCNVTVLDMKDPQVAARAKGLGIQAVPAIVIDGKLANCCRGRDFSETAFRAEGIGQPMV